MPVSPSKAERQVSTTTKQSGYGIPEPGQLVEVRRRQWVVSDIQGDPLSSLSDTEIQHFVTLSSIDEDALGEEIEVVWEIEPGARLLETAGLPAMTGQDDSDRLEAFLDAVRWGAATNADRGLLQAPFRSGITIEDYQLDPLVRAIDMARVNLLIADDVGLGKTIEAGLVVQELLLRHRARTVWVVCPASLQSKWKMEMQEKFGLEFRIVDTEYIHRLRRERGIHANPWSSFPRLISSMDWMKSGEGLRHLSDLLPPRVTYPRKFDILVVDEAHNVAPATSGTYAIESQRTRLVRKIARHFEHRLFLSATPHNGYQESFTSLLELLDDQRFARNVMPEESQLQRIMIRRLKTDLVDADGKPIFPKRELLPLEVAYTDEERKIHRLLRDYTDSRAKSVRGTRFEYGAEFVHSLLKKRLFSSPLAFATTLEKHRVGIDGKTVDREGQGMEERILRKAILRTKEEYANDEEKETAISSAISEVGTLGVPLTPEQRELLDHLGSWADVAKHRPDSKAEAIVSWLEARLKSKDGRWNDHRVILFTEYRSTQTWLQQILASHGYGGDRLMTMHGGMDTKERERVKAAFQTSPKVSAVRILLATDAASEGIDLQNHCNYLIHVEIPWNPNVMEQRNGRIDRHGQKHDTVYVWHPVGKGFDIAVQGASSEVGRLEGDQEYLMRAVMKIEAIRTDLGSVGPVIAHQIEEAMLGKRTRLDTRAAEEKAARARRFVASERRIKERVARLHERLLETRTEFHLSPERVHQAVRVGLNLAELPTPSPFHLSGVPDGTVFRMPMLPGSWGRTLVGLEHPHTGERRPITFDHDVAKGRDDVVLVHLNHPLVQKCLRLLRAEVWSLDDLKKLHRVAVRVVPDSELDTPVVAVWSRLVVTGGNHHRLHEELTLAGGWLTSDGFTRLTQVTRLENLVETAVAHQADEPMFAELSRNFSRFEDAIRASVASRSKDRLTSLENTLRRRKEAEVQDLMKVLDDLERSVSKELDRPEPEQLSLWVDQEREQLRRDNDALRARLASIPEERRSERFVIEQRYENLTERTFPIAVVFLVPQSQAEGRIR